MGWAFDHFDSHFPWKQFNQLAERNEVEPGDACSATSPRRSEVHEASARATSLRSANWLLLVRSDGQPVYEQREQ